MRYKKNNPFVENTTSYIIFAYSKCMGAGREIAGIRSRERVSAFAIVKSKISRV